MTEKQNKTSRVGDKFYNEIEKIQKLRTDNGIDKNNSSVRELTNLIIKHQYWKKIKIDMVNYILPKNKNGMATAGLFIFVFLVLFLVIILGIYLLIFNNITDALRIDINIGQVNLLNVTEATLGKMNTGFTDNADNLGIVLILGMALFMILNAFFIGKKFNKLFIIVDIFILIFVFILSIYISQSYYTLINSSSYLDVYIDHMPKTSTILLSLPSYVTAIGVLIMILSYALIPRSQQMGGSDQVSVYGYG